MSEPLRKSQVLPQGTVVLDDFEMNEQAKDNDIVASESRLILFGDETGGDLFTVRDYTPTRERVLYIEEKNKSVCT